MRSGQKAIDQAKLYAGAGWRHVERLALDIELETTSHIITAAELAAEAAGKHPFMYSAKWAWDKYGLPNVWRHVPLWYAHYDIEPTLVLPTPFGGWEKAVGHQYTNTTEHNGVLVDFNIFDREWVYANV